jgi:hypothetical protein
MKTEIITITPSLAQSLLLANTANRFMRSRHVDYFVQLLRRGEFSLTHQGIAVEGSLDRPIKLIDGQHRLAAIVKSGIPAKMQVTTGAFYQDIYKATDGGANRKLSDRLPLSSFEITLSTAIFHVAGMAIDGAYKKPTPGVIEQICQVYASRFDLLTKTTEKFLSIAAVKAAFLAMDAFDEYREFIAGNFKKMSPAMQFYYKKKISGGSITFMKDGEVMVPTNYRRHCAEFVFAMTALMNPEKDRFKFPSNYLELTGDLAKQYLPEAVRICNG